jgi:hypothetical protein
MELEILPMDQNIFEKAINFKLEIFKLAHTFEDEKKFWVWKYLTNPYKMNGVPHGYVLKQQDNVFGIIGQFALPIKIGAIETTGYAACDFSVDEDFRTYGLFLANKFWRDARPSVSLSTSVNRASFNIHKKFGAEDLEIGCISMMRVINYKKTIRMFFKYREKGMQEERLENNTMTNLSSSLFKTLFKYDFKKFPSGMTVSSINNFNKEFDDFWQKISINYEVAIVRDKKYLTWRYVNYPLKGTKIFAAYDRNGSLSGFISLNKPLDNPYSNIAIDELFTKPDDYSSQNALIKTAINYSKKEGVAALTATNFDLSLNNLFQKNLFFEMKSANSKYLYKFNGSPPENNRWYTSGGDGDVSF